MNLLVFAASGAVYSPGGCMHKGAITDKPTKITPNSLRPKPDTTKIQQLELVTSLNAGCNSNLLCMQQPAPLTVPMAACAMA